MHQRTRSGLYEEKPLLRYAPDKWSIRQATLAFFRNLLAEAWMRKGIASGNSFSVRALAWIAAGHFAHTWRSSGSGT